MEEVVAGVKAKREVVGPGEGFVAQLRVWEEVGYSIWDEQGGRKEEYRRAVEERGLVVEEPEMKKVLVFGQLESCGVEREEVDDKVKEMEKAMAKVVEEDFKMVKDALALVKGKWDVGRLQETK